MPRPTHDADGKRCIIWDDEDQTIVPKAGSPETFLQANDWHPMTAEAKKAASLAKRWQTKQEKEGAKELNAAERAEKKAEKNAEKKSRKTEKKQSKKDKPKRKRREKKAMTHRPQKMVKQRL